MEGHMTRIEELQVLRENCLNGHINKTTFAIEASIHYAALNLPKRAKTVLDLVDEDNLDIDYQLKLLMMKKKLERKTFNKKTCSLNMIVKNESLNITNALSSVDFIMDEIVVCDTGSSDNTIELAELFGAKVVHFPWNDSFSDARNHALKNSSCDHILWFDADDSVTPHDAENLKKLWQESGRVATLLRIVNSCDNGDFFDFSQVRLFPRENGIYFEQAIHEQVMFTLQKNRVPFRKRNDISILHRGYEKRDAHIEKAKRNLKLINIELKTNTKSPSLLMSKGDALTVLNKEKEAFHIYKSIIDNDEYCKINTDIFVQAHLNCANYMVKMKVDRYAIPLLEKALTIDPTRTEAMLALGKIVKKNGDTISAQQLFHKAATTNPPARLTATPSQKIRLEAIYALTDLLIEKGSFDDAATLMTAAIKDYPNVPAFFNLSGKIFLLNQHYKEAAKFYTQSLNISPVNNAEAQKGMALIYNAIGDNKTSDEYIAACA